MKKLTYEFVKEQFENEGYKLLSKGYVNSRTKLGYICPKGHFHLITWNNWQQGNRCYECSVQKIADRNRKDLKYVVSKFKEENYELLIDEYKNCNQKLDYVCPKGHKHNITWSDWNSGCRCPYCAGKMKLTIEFIQAKFEQEGYILLATEYKNCKQKLEYVCPKGHEHSISWGGWSQGQRCPFCYYISRRGIGNNNWKNYSKEYLQKLSIYKAHVWQLTNCNYRKYKSVINPLNLPRKRKKYSLDHIYSISDGFRVGVPAEILASPVNLQMMPYYENIIKRTRSDISLNELYINYSKELDNEL